MNANISIPKDQPKLYEKTLVLEKAALVQFTICPEWVSLEVTTFYFDESLPGWFHIT